VFREAKHFLLTGVESPGIDLEERWKLVIRHCRVAVDSGRGGTENKHSPACARA
jgi:tRNA-dihydrouridine synthase B